MKRSVSTDSLRAGFLKFFEAKGHTIVESDLLAPKADPSLLFTGAGMNQFKEQFLGQGVTFRRAASSQKCLRTADLEKVGATPSHHTFFEMLGNFSFGDYFKKEAIQWAWEFLTEDLKIPPDRLWASVYEEDDEACGIWINDIRMPKQRVVRLGDKDNFWPSEAKKYGPNGPCGPCSEIFYDRGKDAGCKEADCGPACGCGRFVEIWNLVFTQFNRKDGGALTPLANKNIDTGMGLERLASVMQGVKTNFEIDIFKEIITAIAKELGCKYGSEPAKDRHLHAIADHMRAVTFAIADGIYPSNEERGFVIRKLIRKSIQRASGIKKTKAFLYKIVPVVAGVMKAAYPELEKQREQISRVVLSEEEKFHGILETAVPALEAEFAAIKESGGNTVPGSVIFKYSDEKGVPADLQAEIAGEAGLSLDLGEFEELLKQQRERSREKSKITDEIFKEAPVLKGIETSRRETKGRYEAAIKYVREDQVIAVPFGPFYCEAGGQTGDKGRITRRGDGYRADILNTVSRGGLQIFIVPKDHKLKPDDKVEVEHDAELNRATAANHTATHLLHYALRKVLGEHARQSGSMVAPDRLRFDFTHPKKLDERELESIERIVNDKIRENVSVESDRMKLNEARASGAIALFGEKYTDDVTVRKIGDFSKELCGGSHITRTGEIGIFKIIAESSIAAGIRRIEAVTGDAAYGWLEAEADKLARQLRQLSLEAPAGRIEEWSGRQRKEKSGYSAIEQWRALNREARDAVERAKEDQKKKQKENDRQKITELAGLSDDLIKNARVLRGVRVIAVKLDEMNPGVLRSLADLIAGRAAPCVVFLAAAFQGKAGLVLKISGDLTKKGLNAGELIRPLSGVVDGSGGGRPDFAQAGGKDASRLGEAVELIYKLI
ncbi:MAG: alanine--tRNA ligase, partial [Candidatus Omnitrophota bacterium]